MKEGRLALLDATTTATTDEVGSGTREGVLFDREHLDETYQPSDSVSNTHNECYADNLLYEGATKIALGFGRWTSSATSHEEEDDKDD
jgi:hypothetical protein